MTPRAPDQDHGNEQTGGRAWPAPRVAEHASLARGTCIVVPAYDAAKTIEGVLGDLARVLPEVTGRVVVDDGSHDDTGQLAARAGAHVVSHGRNRGKGAALVTGLATARSLGYETALAVDADGQHPAESARDVLYAEGDPRTLVLGIRDLVLEGAPRANRMSNGISNYFLSLFAGRRLRDTQCGLRRYPIRETLALAASASGYAFEAEILLRAADAGMRITERDVRVIYPPEHERVTHFDSVRDPARIIVVVLSTVRDLRVRARSMRA